MRRNVLRASLIALLTGGILTHLVTGKGIAQEPRAAVDAAQGAAEVARDADRQLKAAARFFQSRQFEFAADTYREFLSDYPNHPNAHEAQFFLAECYLHLKRYGEARQAYETYLRKYPTGRYAPWAKFRAGEAAYLAGEWDAAIKHLRGYLDSEPEHQMRPYGIRYLGEALLKTGREEEAKEVFESALRMYGRHPVADRYRYALAQIEEKRGNIEQSLQYYLAVGQGNSEIADDALLAAGTIEYDRRRYAHARQLFEALLQRFPDSPLAATAHFNNGLALYKLKGYQQAASHFQLVRSLAGNTTLGFDASYWLAKTYAAQGRTDDAVAELLRLAEGAKAASNTDAVAKALNEAARLLADQGQFERALDLYLRLARECPDHELAEHALMHAAQVASELGRIEDTVRIARDFQELYPDSPLRGTVALAVVRAALAGRQPELAESWLEPALRSEDEQVALTARYYRALILADRGDLKAALEELEGLLAKPETLSRLPESYFLAGRCAFALQDFDRALRYFTLFLQGHADHDLAAHAHAYRAICLARAGRYEDMEKELSVLKRADNSLYQQCLLACADACYATEAYEEASRLYREVAISQDVPPETAAFALAGAAWSDYYAGRVEAALAGAEEFLNRYGTSPIVPEMLLLRGYALKKQGALEEAVHAFLEVAEKHPDSPLSVDATLAAARTLAQAGRFAEAAERYRAFLDAMRSREGGQGKETQAPVWWTKLPCGWNTRGCSGRPETRPKRWHSIVRF